jgi:predicted dehydrogenase
MSTTLKVAVIGVGGIARIHMPGWEASEHTEVVAGCDINPEALSRWGETHGVNRLVTDPADLFRDPDIDIIDVCTPNNYHAPLTIAALDAGKHVLCEKPLAPTPAEIHAMMAARDRSGKLLMTAQHHRFRGVSRAMKAEIDRGTLGDVYHARSWMLRRAGVPARPGFVIKQHSSGGPCIDIGVHVLDLTLWFMGNPRPVAVTGVARAELAHREGAFGMRNAPIPPEFDVEDFAAAFVRFENGATLILEVSWLLHHNTEGTDSQAWLYGTEGGCHWPTAEFYTTNYATKQHYNRTLKLTADIKIAGEPLRPHALECIAFAQAIVDGAPSPVPAEQSLQVMEILDGVYRSQEAGGEVRLD